ncbi:MAG: hypothetical protein KGL39_20025 [Patescibacteria group bacterium]|nr:hypothetical protein [Patescibacteria group bacterium]
MKKIIVGILMCLASQAWAQQGTPPPSSIPVGFASTVNTIQGYVPASLNLHITNKLTLGVSTDVGDFYTVGARDYNNGQWLAGWGKELFPIKYNSNEVAYLSAQNVFNASEGGKGAIGVALGFRPINMINGIASGIGVVGNFISLPPFAQSLSNYLSIEFGYDYRLQNTPGVSRNVLTIGGQVRVPLNLLAGQ